MKKQFAIRVTYCGQSVNAPVSCWITEKNLLFNDTVQVFLDYEEAVKWINNDVVTGVTKLKLKLKVSDILYCEIVPVLSM